MEDLTDIEVPLESHPNYVRGIERLLDAIAATQGVVGHKTGGDSPVGVYSETQPVTTTTLEGDDEREEELPERWDGI